MNKNYFCKLKLFVNEQAFAYKLAFFLYEGTLFLHESSLFQQFVYRQKLFLFKLIIMMNCYFASTKIIL